MAVEWNKSRKALNRVPIMAGYVLLNVSFLFKQNLDIVR